jgi:hypothetical protein
MNQAVPPAGFDANRAYPIPNDEVIPTDTSTFLNGVSNGVLDGIPAVANVSNDGSPAEPTAAANDGVASNEGANRMLYSAKCKIRLLADQWVIAPLAPSFDCFLHRISLYNWFQEDQTHIRNWKTDLRLLLSDLCFGLGLIALVCLFIWTVVMAVHRPMVWVTSFATVPVVGCCTAVNTMLNVMVLAIWDAFYAAASYIFNMIWFGVSSIVAILTIGSVSAAYVTKLVVVDMIGGILTATATVTTSTWAWWVGATEHTASNNTLPEPNDAPSNEELMEVGWRWIRRFGLLFCLFFVNGDLEWRTRYNSQYNRLQQLFSNMRFIADRITGGDELEPYLVVFWWTAVGLVGCKFRFGACYCV